MEILKSKAAAPVVSANKIIEVGMGFWASKTLLTANKLGLFTLLSNRPLTSGEIREKLELHGHGVTDFLDTLFSLGFLQRVGSGTDATYANTADTSFFLDSNKPGYIGGFLEMANDREYHYWGHLEEALKTGKPQNEVKATGKESFNAIYSTEEGLRVFTEGMSGIQLGSFVAFTETFDFSQYTSLLDIGGSAALLSALVAANHPHMQCTSFDMPALAPFAVDTIKKYGVEDRVSVRSGDFFEESFGKTDIITMGNILHSFDIEKKKLLIKKAYEALNTGGALVIIEMIIDEARQTNIFALLMSLNMLIESDGGFNYTFEMLNDWATREGFKQGRQIQLAGPVSASIFIK